MKAGAPGGGPSAGWATWFLALMGVGCVAGGGLWLAGGSSAADVAWGITTIGALVPSAFLVVAGIRRRSPGVDVIAVLALTGTLLVGEWPAGAVIGLMLATGHVLEARAAARAERDLRALLERAPQTVHRYEGGTVTTPPLADVRPGDLLLVKPGEVVPVDGRIESAAAVLDLAALTGESVPVTTEQNELVQSGAVNAGNPFDLRATETAAGSTFAGIVRLVEQAEQDRPPFVRTADRVAMVFVPVTLAVAGAAWLASGDPVRAVAVLVVATPCPLILAAPIALVSGLARAARRGVIVKGGAVLEQLARARVLVLDKTGTVTRGHPVVTATIVGSDPTDADELLRRAGSLEQLSQHVLASAIVQAATERDLELTWPDGVHEEFGAGISGNVAGTSVRVGKLAWLCDGAPPPWAKALRRKALVDGSIAVFAEIDGHIRGAFVLEDPMRPDASRMIRDLRAAGVERVVLATGDRAVVAAAVAAALGVDDVLAERTPAEKVAAVQLERAHGTTVMVGDGINDAPALAAADVGVALGVRGATASSDAADVVLAVDRIDRLVDGLLIASRTRRIALQSVVAGMGLSFVAMLVASAGYLPPLAGAVLQEAIDVVVIINALRALRGTDSRLRLEGVDAELGHRLQAEHEELRRGIARIRRIADALTTMPAPEALRELRELHIFLENELLPHERAEEEEFYPAVARLVGGSDPTAPMSRGHLEIAHLVHLFGRLVEEAGDTGGALDAGAGSVGSTELDPDDVREIQRLLYGLDAVLRLHFAQEEEGYLSLADEPA